MGIKLQEPPFALPYETIIHGRYLIQEVLGHGGFGLTYRGIDLKENSRIVAIKEYFPSNSAVRIPGKVQVDVRASEKFYREEMDKFLQEARIIYHCDTKHILKIYSLFEENNTAYYVMEYLQGKDLKQLVKDNDNKLEWKSYKPILYDILEALSEVHRKGIIHRDISPDNIFICDDGCAKLIDFGTARDVTDKKTFSVILKKGFAPPEQYLKHGNQGPWTDVYAIAGTSYRVLTGVMPPESVERQRVDTLESLQACGIDVPRCVSNAVEKAMSLDVSDRYLTVDLFKYALDGRHDSIFELHTTRDADNEKTEYGITTLIKSKFLDRFKIINNADGKSVNDKQISEHVEKIPFVRFTKGMNIGQEIEITGDLIFGRNAQACNVFIQDSCNSISRVHCQIHIDPTTNSVLLIDCGSSNGTKLNGCAITPGFAYALRQDSIVDIGKEVQLCFDYK